MKSLRCLFAVLFCLSLVPELSAQTTDQKLYRIYVEDFSKIRNLEQTGVTIYNIDPGSYIEIIAKPEQATRLEAEGFQIEYLGKDFRELADIQRLKASPEYHDYQETMDELQDIADRFPNITKLDILGQSVLGRNLACLKISDNPDMDEDETPILICGAHHGNEVLSVEATLYQINYLVDNYGTDDEVTNWIDNYEIWFVPLVNPDGREAVRRYNDNGVDLNRNYSFEHTATGNHGGPFSEPETQVLRDLTALYPPVMSLTYHTSGQYVLYSWTHTDDAAPDSSAMIYLGNIIAESIEYPEGSSTDHYELMQGGRWYFTAGEYCDYMYATHNTLAFTIEMWTRQNPDGSVIPQVVERNLEGFKTLLRQASKSGITGLITDKNSGEPVMAEICIPAIDDQGKLSPRLADEAFGRFYRYLSPGTYQFVISSAGYRDIIVDVLITEDELTVMDFEMESGPLLELAETQLIDDNGQINIGETPGFLISLENSNSIDAEQTYARIVSGSRYLNLHNDSINFGLIPGLDSQIATDTLFFSLDPDCPDGEIIEFKLEVSDSQGLGWILGFYAEVYAPELSISKVRIVDSEGNENGVFDAGEKVMVDLGISNTGRQIVYDLAGEISTNDPNFTLHSTSDVLLELEGGSSGSMLFEVELASDVPDLFMGNLILSLETTEGYSGDRTFQLNNINGFFDNFDIGDIGWTHASYLSTANHHDDWQLGTPMGKLGDPASAYSGDNCWGNDMGWEWFQNDTWNGAYQRDVYNYLKSPVINCSDMTGVGLRYMRWLTTLTGDVATIKVNDAVVWESARRGQSDREWVEHQIDISDIADGNPKVRIVFELKSNSNNNAGGWNIDDVIVANGLYSSSDIDEVLSEVDMNFACYPNPFSNQISISFTLDKSSFVELQVLDAYGRIVNTIETKQLSTGEYQYHWQAHNKAGTKVSAGIYFIKLSINGQLQANSIILKY
ncbi:MAG: M14 family zinc carboxypeptidase [Bacteroidota bacterium]|nr:M14 family zinc carboxypeptidase [Bacteroidota bacterium]